jgi:RNA polymerase sigma factor (sigma-70 family)
MASAAHPFVARFPACPERRVGLTRQPVSDDHGAEEAALARRAVAGDGDAFAELYTRYEKRAYNLCLRILAAEDDAADATQEAFVRVLRRLPKLEGRDLAFGSYLFTSARHACYDLIERRKRTEPSDEMAEGATPVGGGVGGGGFGFDPAEKTHPRPIHLSPIRPRPTHPRPTRRSPIRLSRTRRSGKSRPSRRIRLPLGSAAATRPAIPSRARRQLRPARASTARVSHLPAGLRPDRAGSAAV